MKTSNKTLHLMNGRERFVFWAIQVFISLLKRIPRETGLLLAHIIAGIWYAVDKRHRDTTLQNLKHSFPGEKNRANLNRLTKKVFQNISRMLFEIAWSYRITETNYHRYFDLVGLFNLTTAQKKGRGVLILTAHMGNWELTPLVMAMKGYQICVIYRILDYYPLEHFVYQMRSRFGVKPLALHHAARGILKGLKKGELIGLLIDRNVGHSRGVFIDFFHRKACADKGLAYLALKTKAPVVPVFIVREGNRFRIECLPEVPLIETGSLDADIIENTQQYNRIIEKFICRYPDQWFWVHRRWKTRPYSPED